MGQIEDIPSGPASSSGARRRSGRRSIRACSSWSQAHRSTLIFVNSRRIAERLAAALNELAGEVLVRSHHGSLARPQRIEVEDRLKAGQIRGLVATSSLELGIDMGAIDLVVQIEAPPSVASGLQRIGRAGHTIGAASRGVIVPKYRGDLVACAAVTRAMHEVAIERAAIRATRSTCWRSRSSRWWSMDDWDVDALFAVVGAPRRSRSSPRDLRGRARHAVRPLSVRRLRRSPAAAHLGPRGASADRAGGRKRVAVINGGTIPDRGLYGVFLLGERGRAARVGELDEEMVFESRVGETFLLGASTWRIEEITHDRVLVTPAPGEPGKMPFWKADAAGRPLELGSYIGQMVRDAAAACRRRRDPAAGRSITTSTRGPRKTWCAISPIRPRRRRVPDDRTILIERCRDELGDWRICVLSPFGGRIHAPWSMAVVERARAETGSTSRRCGPTTGSWCGFRRPTSRRTRG